MDKSYTLTPSEIAVLQQKGTDMPHTGKFTDFDQEGTYLCRQCGLALFRSSAKFLSSCGWPSFDDECKDAILRKPDADGVRTEIVCNRCHGHLGHVFKGEGLTQNNLRHCVNSTSIEFIENLRVLDTEEAIIAGGCFWGIEHHFSKIDGILLSEVIYTGGHTENPTYEQVCQKNTGHLEAVRLIYDPNVIDYKSILGQFFEIHDFTQKNGQGVDIGPQYLSAIFYLTAQQQKIAESMIKELEASGHCVSTSIRPASVTWKAEDYHQHYFKKQNRK